MFAVLLITAASAHIVMDAPTPRYADQKNGPCGRANDARTGNVTAYNGGDVVTVEWHETINHPGTFRISFDDDGHDGFADPANYTDYYVNATVLLDAIVDEADSVYTAQVTLPNITCTNCTLQLIQLMTDKPPYAPGTNDIYYQCADITIAAVGTPETGDTGTPTVPTTPTNPTTGTPYTDPTTDPYSDPLVDTGTSADNGGCGCAGARLPLQAGWLALGMVGLLGLRRRSGV